MVWVIRRSYDGYAKRKRQREESPKRKQMLPSLAQLIGGSLGYNNTQSKEECEHSGGVLDQDGDCFYDASALEAYIATLPDDIQFLIDFKDDKYEALKRRRIKVEDSKDVNDLDLADAVRYLCWNWNELNLNSGLSWGHVSRTNMEQKTQHWKARLARAMYTYFLLSETEQKAGIEIMGFSFVWKYPMYQGQVSSVVISEHEQEVMEINRGFFTEYDIPPLPTE